MLTVVYDCGLPQRIEWTYNLLLTRYAANEYGSWVNLAIWFRLSHKSKRLASIDRMTSIINNNFILERAKHSFLLCPILLSCLAMNKICLNRLYIAIKCSLLT